MVSKKQEYDIRTIAEITGMNPITLRAWEQRYQLVVPKRAANGRRIYTQDDLEKISSIIGWVKQGIPISKVQDLLESHAPTQPTFTKKMDASWNAYQSQMLNAIKQFDFQKLDDVYNDLISMYPFYLVLNNLIKPIMIELGDHWKKQQTGIANEHFFSHYVRNKIGARILHLSTKRTNKDTLLLACLPNEQHELGLLCFTLHAMENGFNCISLGQNLPIDELERSIAVIKPSLSILYGLLSKEIILACKKIIKKLNTHIAFVAREGSEDYHFNEKGLYKLTCDFDFSINAIRKIMAYTVKN